MKKFGGHPNGEPHPLSVGDTHSGGHKLGKGHKVKESKEEANYPKDDPPGEEKGEY